MISYNKNVDNQAFHNQLVHGWPDWPLYWASTTSHICSAIQNSFFKDIIQSEKPLLGVQCKPLAIIRLWERRDFGAVDNLNFISENQKFNDL